MLHTALYLIIVSLNFIDDLGLFLQRFFQVSCFVFDAVASRDKIFCGIDNLTCFFKLIWSLIRIFLIFKSIKFVFNCLFAFNIYAGSNLKKFNLNCFLEPLHFRINLIEFFIRLLLKAIIVLSDFSCCFVFLN